MILKARNKFTNLFLSIFSTVIINILLWNMTRIRQNKYFFMNDNTNEPFSPNRLQATSFTEVADIAPAFIPAFHLDKRWNSWLVSHTWWPTSCFSTYTGSTCTDSYKLFYLFLNDIDISYPNTNFQNFSKFITFKIPDPCRNSLELVLGFKSFDG